MSGILIHLYSSSLIYQFGLHTRNHFLKYSCEQSWADAYAWRISVTEENIPVKYLCDCSMLKQKLFYYSSVTVWEGIMGIDGWVEL